MSKVILLTDKEIADMKKTFEAFENLEEEVEEKKVSSKKKKSDKDKKKEDRIRIRLKA